MADEQDWSDYPDQAHVAVTDTFLLRTAAGAGVEVAGAHVMARQADGGPFIASGAGQFITAGATFNITPDDSSGANGVILEASFASGGYGPIKFKVAGGEVARLNGGALFVGTTTDWTGGYGKINAQASIAGGRAISVYHSGTGSGSTILSRVDDTAVQFASFFYGSGTQVGSITTNGTATAYNTSSDHRLKDDYELLTGSLARILALPVYDFRWIGSGERARGFKAHEFGEVIPGAATGEKDGMRKEEYVIEPERVSDVLGPQGQPIIIPAVIGTREVPDYQGIDQSKAVPDLVGAVQEMAAMIDDLSARLAALEAATGASA